MKVYYDTEIDRIVIDALDNDAAPRSLILCEENGHYWVCRRSTGRKRVDPLIMSEVRDQNGGTPSDPVAYVEGVFSQAPAAIQGPKGDKGDKGDPGEGLTLVEVNAAIDARLQALGLINIL